ncbi:class I SAM-dependent methyltransferase [Candidatus Woesearchaeota archaeon]|nr:class I SAM-dependent methyltransferase [Candidatus Woesearchaeota archaeon]
MNYYNSISKGYEELHKEEQLKKVNIIKRYLEISKSDRLLDVGCGTGLTTSPWKCKKYGIDPAENLLKKARLKDKIIYKKASAEKIPFKSHFFDVVVSITAIQNFDDIEKGLKEIKRVGKDKFILSFLKKSKKRKKISKLIKKHFKVRKIIEEEKDIIYIAGV